MLFRIVLIVYYSDFLSSFNLFIVLSKSGPYLEEAHEDRTPGLPSLPCKNENIFFSTRSTKNFNFLQFFTRNLYLLS